MATLILLFFSLQFRQLCLPFDVSEKKKKRGILIFIYFANFWIFLCCSLNFRYIFTLIMEKLIKISLDETEKQYIKERASKNVHLTPNGHQSYGGK